MTAEILDSGDARWPEVLDRVPHDVYHRPGYVEVCARHDGGRPLAIYAGSADAECLMPLIVRPLPASLGAAGEHDAYSPYGYASPVFAGATPDRLDESLAAISAAATEAGLVASFIRLHPLLPLDREVLARHGELIVHGPTVYIDVTQPVETIWRGVRENHRSGIKRLKKAGWSVVIDDWSRYGDFIDIYTDTMSRVTADQSYFFSREYFDDLRRAMGDDLHLFTVVSPAGTIGSAGLFFSRDGMVEYHLGGTADQFLSVAPSKLMFDAVWRWAQESGHRAVHLGGGLGARRDSLFNFKAGFSSAVAEFASLRMIFNPARYEELAATADRTLGPVAESAANFFPIYRAPRAGA